MHTSINRKIFQGFIYQFIAFGLMMVLHMSNAQAAASAVSPVSVSVIPPVQLPPSEYAVTGARVSAIWGHHRSVYGIDVGLIGNVTDQNFGGLAIAGGFNITQGSTTIMGLQLAGLTNINYGKTSTIGLQIAGLWNHNSAESSAEGIQLALLGNHAPFTNIYGAQIGLYNSAKSVYGIQIGLINFAADLHGIQIGLLNFNHNGLFSIAPFLNVGF